MQNLSNHREDDESDEKGGRAEDGPPPLPSSEGGACAVLSKRGCSGVFSVSVLDNSKALLSVAGEKGLPVRFCIVLGDGAADFGCAG